MYERTKTHLCLEQEDVKTSRHALYAVRQGLMFPVLHILGLVS